MWQGETLSQTRGAEVLTRLKGLEDRPPLPGQRGGSMGSRSW
jgi:hypothetical protein